MGSALLEKRMHIASDGTLHLQLPDTLRDQEVEVHVRSIAPRTEVELIAEINRPLPSSVRARYEALTEKRSAETLLPGEYEELQTLTDAVEGDHLRRWENLATLANRLNEPLQTLAVCFGLFPQH
jgi:hypothetical protein